MSDTPPLGHVSQQAADDKLFRAVIANDTKSLVQALKGHAYVNARISPQTPHSNTPLLEAIEHGHLRSMVTLINHGANVNKPNALHDTPLHAAIRENNKAMIETLLSVDSNLNRKNLAKQTPAQLASALGYRAVATRLNQIMEREQAPLAYQTENPNSEIGLRPVPRKMGKLDEPGVDLAMREKHLMELYKTSWKRQHTKTFEDRHPPRTLSDRKYNTPELVREIIRQKEDGMVSRIGNSPIAAAGEQGITIREDLTNDASSRGR